MVFFHTHALSAFPNRSNLQEFPLCSGDYLVRLFSDLSFHIAVLTLFIDTMTHTQPSGDSSGSKNPEKSLGSFVRDLSSALRDLNSCEYTLMYRFLISRLTFNDLAVLSMTEAIVDGALTEGNINIFLSRNSYTYHHFIDLPVALETTAIQSASDVAEASNAEAFVVVPGSEQPPASALQGESVAQTTDAARSVDSGKLTVIPSISSYLMFW